MVGLFLDGGKVQGLYLFPGQRVFSILMVRKLLTLLVYLVFSYCVPLCAVDAARETILLVQRERETSERKEDERRRWNVANWQPILGIQRCKFVNPLILVTCRKLNLLLKTKMKKTKSIRQLRTKFSKLWGKSAATTNLTLLRPVFTSWSRLWSLCLAQLVTRQVTCVCGL